MQVDIGGYVATVDEAGGAAGDAERVGYDGWWALETKHDPFLGAAIAGERTERVQLGTQIAVAFARNPMTVATTANDLQLLSEGRFELAVELLASTMELAQGLGCLALVVNQSHLDAERIAMLLCKSSCAPGIDIRYENAPKLADCAHRTELGARLRSATDQGERRRARPGKIFCCDGGRCARS